MLKLLLLVFQLCWLVLEPLAEVGVHVWNGVQIDKMIKDPESHYGEKFIFESLWAELDPYAEIVPFPYEKLDPWVELENTTGTI